MDVQFISEFNHSLQDPKQRSSKRVLKQVVFNLDCPLYYKRVGLEALLTVIPFHDLADQITVLVDNLDDPSEQDQIQGLIKKYQLSFPVKSASELVSAGRQLWKTGSLKAATRFFKKVLQDEEVLDQDCLTVIHTMINDCYETKQKEAIVDVLEGIYSFLQNKCYFHHEHQREIDTISYATVKDILGTLFRLRSQQLQERNMQVFKERMMIWRTSDRIEDVKKPLLWIADVIDVAQPAEIEKMWSYLLTWITEPQFHPALPIRSQLTVQIYAAEHLMHSFKSIEQNTTTEFLLAAAENTEYSTFIRGDALDVLLRNPSALEYRERIDAASLAMRAVREDTEVNARRQARELGQQDVLINQGFGNAVAGTTYNNAQNVHATEVNEAIKDSLLSMFKDPEVRGNTIYQVVKDIGVMIDNVGMNKSKCNRARAALDQYVEDPAVFTEQRIKLSAVLVMVWNRIIQHLEHHELYKRLVDELSEAYNTCATGHLARAVSVLAGYFEDIKQFASFETQLKNNIKARVNAGIRAAPEEEQGDLLIGLVDHKCEEYKVLEAFLERIRDGIHDEHLPEFVPEYLSAESFELIFASVWAEY